MKTKYSINSDNRLFMQIGDESLAIDGEFSVDEENRLNFWFNEPAEWRKKYDLPEKLIFDGNWRFSNDYDLELVLKSANEEGVLSLKGTVISAEDDKLVFEIESKDKKDLNHISLIKLSGNWMADSSNQLFFSVNKKDSSDALTLRGGWQINQNQQISYAFDKTSSTITFSGFWQIASQNRLIYTLSSGTNSKFDFKVALQTPSIYPQEGTIKYRLGIGVNEQTISLFGVWKINRDLGLSFDMEYAEGEIRNLEFSANVHFNKNDEIAFALRSNTNQDIGINVIFTHKFLEEHDAQAFLRLKHSARESGVDMGIKILF